MPTDPLELPRIGQRSLFSIGVSATFPATQVLYDSSLLDVRLRGGTRVRLRVDPGGCHVTAAPGLEAIGAGPIPDIRLEHAAYMFRESRFDIDTAGLSSALIDPLVEKFLNDQVRPKLPAKLRSSGYRPQKDGDIPGTVQGLTKLLPLGAEPSGGAPAVSLDGARDLAVAMTLQASQDVTLAVPGLDGMEVFLEKGTLVNGRIRTHGKVTDPRLRDLELSAPTRGVVIRSTGTGLLASLESLSVSRVTVTPSSFAFDYTLLIEQLAESALLMAELARMLAGHYMPTVDVPEIQLRSLRTNIDLMLVEGLSALFTGLLDEYDTVIPGISLKTLFAG